jgi:hypothetical protein
LPPGAKFRPKIVPTQEYINEEVKQIWVSMKFIVKREFKKLLIVRTEQFKIEKLIKKQIDNIKPLNFKLKQEEQSTVKSLIKDGVYCESFPTRKDFQGITHLKVYMQQSGETSMLCGFHCYKNLEYLSNAILAPTKF